MTIDLLIAGVGGQGILSIAAIIARAALHENLHLKQMEIHGMAQRGGAVQSHLRLSSETIFSDIIPRGGADVILAVEPLEALRYLAWLKPAGWLVTNDQPVKNIATYPDLDGLLGEIRAIPHHFLLNATALAKEHGTARAMNVAMLGAASPFLRLSASTLEAAIREQFQRKGEDIVTMNLAVFQAARKAAQQKSGDVS